MTHWSKRFNEALTDSGMKVADLARLVPIKDSLLYKYEEGGVDNPRGSTMRILAEALQVKEEWLRLGILPKREHRRKNDPDTAKIDDESTLTVVKSTLLPEAWPKTIPVRGTAAGSSEGAFQVMSDTIEFLRRPEALANKSVYALYIQNDSMEPRYFSGEAVIVDENRPPSVGDHVIVQYTENGTDIQAMCKRLVRRSGSKVTFSQYNPTKNIEIETFKIVSIHRIIPLAEIHGF